ncbi:MAG TPA: hypothetical protein VGI60_04990 [Chthoniobacterales bacterium]|jgi:hypothetical protein
MKVAAAITVILVFSAPAWSRAEPEASPSPPGSAETYEELPVLKASEILRTDVLTGLHHKVREDVPTYSGANRFTIDSDFGVFEADGNAMLLTRISEINAIARLKEISRTDEYKNALLKAAKSPVRAAKQIIGDPMGTVENAQKGIMKFMSSAGESLKGIGKTREANKYEGSKMQQVIGFSDAKRKMAISLGVDPYTSNSMLQQELEEIAWASFAGGATFSLATLPIGGGAGIALTTTGIESSLEDILRDESATDLKISNRRALIAMGATDAEANSMLENAAFSPTAATAFVVNLKSLDGLENRRAFIKAAGMNSSAESDAVFCVQTAALMSKLHHGEHRLAQITTLGHFPICLGKDGTVIVALQWDYAAHTKLAADFAQALALRFNDKPSRLVAISGMVSPQLRHELEAKGYTVQDRFMPGPLK